MSSAMADSEHLYGKTRFARGLNSSVGKLLSLTHFFRKFLFFALFLIAIPLFPSQAPDFINQSVLTKLWELVHLLFIGVAVSYGLFCRRNDGMDIETQPNTDYSQSFVSRVFNISSIFEDGFDNSYGYGEKNVFQNSYSENSKGEEGKARSLNCEIEFENPCGYGENNASQAWNSQCFQGESMIVVNQENCAVHEYDHKSSGLPVRSLGSRVRNQDSSEISDGNESGLFSTYSSNSPTESINETFGDLGPMNLENRFNENAAAVLTSPVPRRLISGRTGMRENVDISSRPSHFRPLSVDETQFESLKSQSFWSSEAFSSQNSSISDSSTRLSPSHAGSLDLANLKKEILGKDKTFRHSYPPASKPENGKTSLNAFHIRRYTDGSLFKKNARKNFEDDLKDRGGNKREDRLGTSREWRSSSMKLDQNPAKQVKASSRGKSVRTIRSCRFTAEATKTGERSGRPSDEIEAVYRGKSEIKSGGFFDNLSVNSRKQNIDNQVAMPKPTHSELQKRKNKEPSENIAVQESKEKTQLEAESFPLKWDEESVTASVNDAETDPSEVDKKAGEFIAKFRGQIRLQKIASMDKSSREFHRFR